MNRAADQELKKRVFITGSGIIELELFLDDARRGYHSGACDLDIRDLLQAGYIADQLAAINPDTLADELKEWGTWSADELADHEQNKARILWLACGDIVDSCPDDLEGGAE